jgi:hypothetical protein
VVDGEEITNKIPGIQEVANAPLLTDQMCLIHRDFKHFHGTGTKDFRVRRKVPSIMSAKVLSIMRANAGLVTPD